MFRLLTLFLLVVALAKPLVALADSVAPTEIQAPATGSPAKAETAAPSAPTAPTAPPASPASPAPDKTSPPPLSPPPPAAAAPAAESPDVVALPAAATPAKAEEAFNRALTAYQAGAWEEARREFLAIVEGGNLSAPLAHNLGNLEFRKGNPGQAVLWYKRALAIQPFSPETLQNLRTIRLQTAFLSFDPWGLSLGHLKLRWVETVTILSAWAVVLLIVWLVWLTPRSGLRWPLVTLLILLLPMLAGGSFLTWKLQNDPQPLRLRQIVANKETNAYAAPAEASSSVMSLPAGSEVVPLETRGNWLYCSIPGGSEGQPLRGWIRSAKLEPLWPWPAGI